MKEAAGGGGGEQMEPSDSGGGGGMTRTAADKERTKMRERQRRSITTKIFHGLRKHGGYRLSPRADMNEVLRQLAKEAGWIVDSDGTTYRSSTTNASNLCPACNAGKKSGTPTPTSSFVSGGGECSTTASPRRTTVGDSVLGYGGGPTSLYYSGISSGGSTVVVGGGGYGVSSSPRDTDNALAMYMRGRLSGGPHDPSAATCAVVCGGPSAVTLAAYQHQQQMYLQEARASNQNTPVGSPQRRV